LSKLRWGHPRPLLALPPLRLLPLPLVLVLVLVLPLVLVAPVLVLLALAWFRFLLPTTSLSTPAPLNPPSEAWWAVVAPVLKSLSFARPCSLRRRLNVKPPWSTSSPVD
jgi:hypothetical protein